MRSRTVLLSVLFLGLAACHDDVTCVYDTDCASQGSSFVCVPDSSGFGHCLPASLVFGAVQDGGTGAAGSDAGAATADAGFDAGPAADAGLDAGPAADAGEDAGQDAGSDAGPQDAGSDAGPSDAG